MKFKKFIKSLSIFSLIFVTALSTFYGLPQRVQALVADTPSGDNWIPDGRVYATEYSADGSTMYIGGDFRMVGPHTGSRALFNASTGQRLSSFPIVNGSTHVSIPDGDGGWYIGGTFNKVGDQTRTLVAHILPNGEVDPNFNHNIPNNFDDYNVVTALALDSEKGTLYIGGRFRIIDGQTRNHLASIDLSTGTLTDWNPNIGISGIGVFFPVNTLAVDSSNSILYVGGAFVSVGGQTRNNLASFDTVTGALTSWNPNILLSNSTGVRTIKLDSANNTLYVGGRFSWVGVSDGQTRRNNLASFDTTTGALTSWNPNVTYTYPEVVVNDMALDSTSNLLYIGGTFSNIGGPANTRNNVAAINTNTGAATSWNPNVTADRSGTPEVTSIAMDSANSFIYFGGRFDKVGGQDRLRIAAVDTSNGLLTNWNPSAGDLVMDLLISNDVLSVGGFFQTVDGKNRWNLASINTTTGHVTNWDPHISSTFPTYSLADRYVSSLELDASRSILYVGGRFQRVGGDTIEDGQERMNLASFNTVTGELTSWDPLIFNYDVGTHTIVEALELDSTNNKLYVGGTFSTVGPNYTPRRHLASFDAVTGGLTTWNPNVGGIYYQSGVNDILIDLTGNTLYVGGHFPSVGGQTRNNLASFNIGTGALTGWNPGSDGQVIAFELANGQLYVGGAFNQIAGQVRKILASFDTSNGSLNTWDPATDGYVDGWVRSMVVGDNDSTLYVGGDFKVMDGQTRGRLAAFNVGNGDLLDWNPVVNFGPPNLGYGFGYVTSLGLNPGNRNLHAAGGFPQVDDMLTSNLAVFPASSISCSADFNGDDSVDNGDIFAFLTAWFAGDMDADMDHNRRLEVADIFAFLSTWFAGC